MTTILIDFVKHHKEEFAKLVKPNFIYNRFDKCFDRQFELIKITTQNKEYYVHLHVENCTAILGLYMIKLPQEAFNKLIDFVFSMYSNVDFIEIKHSLNSHNDLISGNQWTIELPDTEEKYISSLGKKTRLHIKQYFKLFQQKLLELIINLKKKL